MKLIDLFNSYNKSEITFPYIIAEAGVNHEGKMDLAKRLIDEAKEGGADAIKFQTYKADTLTSKNSPAYWDTTKEPTKTQYALFKKHDKFWKKEFVKIKEYCDKVGIEFLSTPFDIESAKFLNDLMDVFKISSSDITNKPFIEFICNFKKPIILSTGASYLYEIQEAVEWIETLNNPLVLLHCILNYPTSDKNANLGMIIGLKEKFPDNIIGYSDHTLPKDMKSLEIATLLGAKIIEKHFTFDKTLPGNDHYHAMNKEDLKIFITNLERDFNLLGSFKVSTIEDEKIARENARRSLVSKYFIPKDKIIEPTDISWKRPGSGISPRNFNKLIGLKSKEDIPEDKVLTWNLFYG